MARDGYEVHYAEKIWDRVPEMYRDLDGRPPSVDDPGGRHQLRALVEVLAGQAAVLRRSIDRLWDDQFIDLCDDWAVPYLGDLVGTRLVSALDTRARRVDVASTVHYRRRAGTLRLLEQLVGDIAGWEGVVVESFRRLGRTWHRLDPEPSLRAGPITGTPPGGVADLRRPLGAQRAGGPFDEYAHTPDVRRHRGTDGRYAISKLVFHLYRLSSLPVVQARLTQATNNRSFTVDPLGRDTTLFARPDRPLSWDHWVRLEPWQVPAPISCALLNHTELELTPEAVAAVTGGSLGLSAAAVADLELLRGNRVRSSGELRSLLESRPTSAELLADPVRNAIEAASLVEDCGKWGLLATDGQRSPSLRIEVNGTTVPPEEIVAGDLSVWRDPPPGRTVIVDPQRGRLRFASPPGATARIDYHAGCVAAVGAATHPRRGLPAATDHRSGGGAMAAPGDGEVVEIDDSLTYNPVTPVSVPSSVTLQAAERELPLLRRNQPWVFDTGAATDARLELSGVWVFGGHPVVLRGDFAEVVISHCNLDPGTAAAGTGVSLQVEGNVGLLRIERSVTGPIVVDPAAVVGVIELSDSIVEPDDPTDPASLAIDTLRTTVDAARITALGAVRCQRLWSTDSLFVHHVEVTDTQSGCFRFSAAPAGSRLPHPYESAITPATNLFTTRQFPQPGYGQLIRSVPDAIGRGAENGSEMGAFSAELGPISLDSLQAKFGEYLPIGRLPVFAFVT